MFCKNPFIQKTNSIADKLVGDYQSDSDNDDSEHKHRATKNITTGELLK